MPELKRILCPVDFSEFSMRAYRYSVSVASQYGAKLFVQHIVELWRYPYADFAISPGLYDQFCQTLCEKSEMELQQLVNTRSHSEVRTECVVQRGMVPDCILAFAKDQKVDLIVMGTHGWRGFDRMMRGSATERVMRRASCPVLAVNKPLHSFVGSDHQPGRIHLSRILFCTDFSEISQRALGHAISLTVEYGAELILLHVFQDIPEPIKIQNQITTAIKQLDAMIPPETYKAGKGKPKTIVRFGKPYQQIIQLATETQTDLVIMAVRRRRALDLALFGSTTNRVIEFGAFPVLATRV